MDTRLSLPLETKFSNVSNAGEFTGMASTFGNIDLQGDIVMPGAFVKSLADHKANKTSPAMLWHHRTDEPIGVWTSLSENQNGLAVEGKLSLETSRGSDAHALMKDGALALSIGFVVGESDFDNKGNRLLEEVELWEISAVAMPANQQARISSVKSISNLRELETKLHDVGFSVRESRKLARGGWDALRGKDESNELTQVAQLIRASAKRYQ